jgi:Putative DNA-binding domain/Bacterial PH domain
MFTIKRSPIVLIRTFVVIEILGFVLYFLAVQIGDYKVQLYNQLSLTSLSSYQTSKFLLLSGAQLLITIYAFLNWYFERYLVRPGMIVHQWGVLFKRRETILLKETASVISTSSVVGNLLRYGSILIQNGSPGNELRLSDISRPERYLKLISKSLGVPHDEKLNDHRWTRPDIPALLAEDEHERLEFKSSLRFDHHTQSVNRGLEKTIMKTVAAFLNSGGGQLVIGVDDSKQVLGIHHDYRTLKKEGSDGFENHFTQIFNTMIGPELRNRVHLWFSQMNGHDVCVVDVAASFEPAYLKADNDEQFYVRTGNVSTPLKLSEVEHYARARWPKRLLS